MLRWKPVNGQDPVTMEDVTARRTEDGGRWFWLVLPAGHVYQYNADALFNYLLAQKAPEEPQLRHPLSAPELGRLSALVSMPTKESCKCKDARVLLTPETRQLHEEMKERREVAFVLENDLLSILRTLELACESAASDHTETFAYYENDIVAQLLPILSTSFQELKQFDSSAAEQICINRMQPLRQYACDHAAEIGEFLASVVTSFLDRVMSPSSPAPHCVDPMFFEHMQDDEWYNTTIVQHISYTWGQQTPLSPGSSPADTSYDPLINEIVTVVETTTTWLDTNDVETSSRPLA